MVNIVTNFVCIPADCDCRRYGTVHPQWIWLAWVLGQSQLLHISLHELVLDAMQWLLTGGGAACTLMVYFGLPETAHFTTHNQVKDRIESETGRRPKFVCLWANPFQVFGLLLRPNVCMMVSFFLPETTEILTTVVPFQAFVAGFALMTNYVGWSSVLQESILQVFKRWSPLR